MKGQTELQPCAWCGDASEGVVELTPPRRAKDKQGRDIQRGGRKVPACARHLAIPIEKRPRVPKRKQKEQLF